MLAFRLILQLAVLPEGEVHALAGQVLGQAEHVGVGGEHCVVVGPGGDGVDLAGDILSVPKDKTNHMDIRLETLSNLHCTSQAQ